MPTVPTNPNPFDAEYTVKGHPITVRHFERAAQFMAQTVEGLEDLPLHGKMPALKELIRYRAIALDTEIGCFASHGSNWALGVPILANTYGLKSSIVYATNPDKPKYPDWLVKAREHGVKLLPLRPNMTAINSAQAKKLVEARGAYFIPFGLADTSGRVLSYLTEAMSFPNDLETLVLCSGSGITLTGILLHLEKYNKRIRKIVAVSSGRPASSILQTVTSFIDPLRFVGHLGELDLQEGYTYSQNMTKVQSVWETHPYYERKAYDWLEKNIASLRPPVMFLNMGV